MKEKTDILIFSASYGGGHRRVSYAVERALATINKDINTKVIDLFELLSPTINKFNLYSYVTTMRNAPFVYGWLYELSYDLPLDNIFNRLSGKIGLKKLSDLINKLNPKVVLSTYPTYGGIISELKKNREVDLVSTVVITDFVAHSQWIHSLVDHYFVPSYEVKYHLVKKGISPDTIEITGIPISEEFLISVDRAEVLKKYDLRDGLPLVLIMAGIFGMTRGVEEICEVIKELTTELQAVVLCGNDKKLFKKLEDMFSYTHNIKPILGQVEVHKLMDVSSLLISKSGGITVSEALAKELPILVYKPLPGQEYHNAVFLSKAGAGIIIKNKGELKNILKHILTENPYLTQMKEATKTIKMPGASIDVAKGLLSFSKD